MTVDEAFTTVRDALLKIAPDVDVDNLGSETRLREDLELDSLDFEGFIVQLSERTRPHHRGGRLSTARLRG